MDIHTHRRLLVDGAIGVESLSVESITQELVSKDYSTAGIHPWWLEDYTDAEIENLKSHVLNLVKNQKLWGIGETGLDRTMPELLDKQRELFYWHMELSEEFKLPLVIHNVRSGSDFLEVLKQKRPTSPWVFHDFRGNEELMRALLKLHSQSYFSFGLSIDNSPQIRELLPSVPVENLFLETDDQKHLDIHEIYLRASEQLHVDIEFLKSQIWHNFKKVSRPIH